MGSKADKLRKQAIKEQQRRIKPGECAKYVRLVLDQELLAPSGLGQALLRELEQMQLKYQVRSLPVKNCVVWERHTQQRQLALDEAAALAAEWEMEKQVMKLLFAHELPQTAKHAAIEAIGKELCAAFPDRQLTLTVLNKGDKSSASNALTAALIELQLLQQVATLQLPPNVGEVAALLRRFTKAISEVPYKQQQAATLRTFKKFLANDKKQCVRVVGTNGFGRLWQQHLNRLPLVTLEVAESIIAQYSCPKKLLDAFAEDPQAVQRLADLKINRAGPQPLQTDRRIGNVLSGKLHLLYTSRDPNALI